MALVAVCGSLILLAMAVRSGNHHVDGSESVKKEVERLKSKFPKLHERQRSFGMDPAEWFTYPYGKEIDGVEWRVLLGMRMMEEILSSNTNCAVSNSETASYVRGEVWRLKKRPTDVKSWLKARAKDRRRACDLRITMLPMY